MAAATLVALDCGAQWQPRPRATRTAGTSRREARLPKFPKLRKSDRIALRPRQRPERIRHRPSGRRGSWSTKVASGVGRRSPGRPRSRLDYEARLRGLTTHDVARDCGNDHAWIARNRHQDRRRATLARGGGLRNPDATSVALDCGAQWQPRPRATRIAGTLRAGRDFRHSPAVCAGSFGNFGSLNPSRFALDSGPDHGIGRTELLKALDSLYEPGFFQPDDFAELAQRLVSPRAAPERTGGT